MLRNRLLWQMFFTAGFAAIAASLVIYIAVQLQLSSELENKAALSLDSQLSFAQVVGKAFLQTNAMEAGDQWVKEIKGLDTRLSIINSTGVVVFDSKRDIADLDNHSNRPEVIAALANGRGESKRFSHSLETDMRYIAVRMMQTDTVLGVVRLSSAVQLTTDTLIELRKQLLGVIFITLIILFGASYLLALRFYRPIAVATEYAQEIADGNYQLRLPGLGVDEVARLERSLNGLARKTEERLDGILESRNQVTGILSGLKEGVVALDSEERIAHINDSALRLLQLDNQVLGKKVWEVIQIPSVQAILESVLAHNDEKEHALMVGDKSLELSIETLGQSGTGNIDGLILVFHDITERAHLDQIRTDFVANASHELKTPLAAIKGMVETIIDDPQMPTNMSNRFMHRVLKQTNRLHKIVLDLMQLSRFDSFEKQRFTKEEIDMVRELRQICSVQASVAEENNVSLEVHCEHDRLFVLGESEAMSQLISNLIENAIKYSPSGSKVKIDLDQKSDLIVFSVSDNGIGIPHEEQQRIFERFYRVDTARSREMGGTGLGLSIVKHIVQAHDGNVSLKSEPGEGSTFTAKIPAAR